tara:strand:- start:1679 stop:2674 length:996 start_codon:yes stop_codon:yes gene_type:complete
MDNKLSIIIPFYNSEKTLKKCLEAIYNSNFKKFEVIAVSDNSKDSSCEIVKNFPCKLIELKKNSGSATARNTGAKEANGQILVFLDSDVIIKDDALGKINQKFLNREIHLLQGIYSHQPSYKNFTTQYLQSYNCYYLFSKGTEYTQTLCTCFISMRKNLFFDLGCFDEIFKSSNSEDEDFGYKVLEKGYKIPVDRTLETFHDIEINLFDYIKRSIKMHLGEMKLYLRKKNLTNKLKQKNYFSVIIGIILIFLITLSPVYDYFFNIPNFGLLFLILNFSFISINLNFLKFIFSEKGIIITIFSILFVYLDRFIMMLCAGLGIIDFFILRNKS